MSTEQTQVKEIRKRRCPFPPNITEEEEEALLNIDPNEDNDNEEIDDIAGNFGHLSVNIMSDEENDDIEDENVIEKADDETTEKTMKLRNYQKELAEVAVKGDNTIVCAGTGAGKTRVAFYILQQHLQRNPNGRVAILAEKVFLVDQHYAALIKVLPELQAKTLNMSGQKQKSDELSLVIKDYQVVILTPALIVNTIKSEGPASKFLLEFSLIVFDECHHTHKKSNYNQLMNQYHMMKNATDSTNQLPQIVGLTATMGTNKANSIDGARSHMLQIMANLDVRKLSTVERNSEEYEKYCTHAKSDKHGLEENANDPVHLAIEKAMVKVEDKLKEAQALLDQPQDEDEKSMETTLRKAIKSKNDPSYIQWTTELQEKGSSLLKKKPKIASMVKIGAMYLKILSETMEINEALRVTDAMKMLDKRMERDHLGPYCNPNDAMENAFADVAKDLKRDIENVSKNMDMNDEKRHINKLLKLIKDYYDEKQNDIRFMVFVKTREVAEALADFLNETGFACRPFTGVSAASEEGGTSRGDQQKITQMFKTGEILGIVATTAAEEGLDIPDCNFVIQYNYVGNEISTRQTTGRIRKAGGKRVLLTKQKESIRDTINHQRYLLMQEAQLQVLKMSADDISRQIKVKQDKIAEDEKRRRAEKPQVAKDRTTGYKMICNKCGKFEIDCDKIRSIKKQHHAVIDPLIWNKVEIKPMPKGPVKLGDGIEFNGRLFGNTSCKHELGVVSSYQSVRLPFISHKFFRVLNLETKASPKLPKWDFAPFEIREIDDNDLCDMALRGQQ